MHFYIVYHSIHTLCTKGQMRCNSIRWVYLNWQLSVYATFYIIAHMHILTSVHLSPLFLHLSLCHSFFCMFYFFSFFPLFLPPINCFRWTHYITGWRSLISGSQLLKPCHPTVTLATLYHVTLRCTSLMTSTSKWKWQFWTYILIFMNTMVLLTPLTYFILSWILKIPRIKHSS